jgi:hypothetical protein
LVRIKSKICAFVFGKPTPDPEALIVTNGVCEAFARYSALGANCLGPALTADQRVSPLPVHWEENSGIFVATASIELPGPQGLRGG